MQLFPEGDESIHAHDTPSFASERFSRQIEELLFIMGRPELDIDDESQFSDFFKESGAGWEEFKDAIKKTYKIDLDIEDCFWEVAQEIDENS